MTFTRGCVFYLNLLLSTTFLLVLSSPVEPAPTCKSVPGHTNWPGTDIWRDLNRTLNGQLLAPLPPAIVCDTSMPQSYDKASCDAVGRQWFNSSFHADDPVSADWPNWEKDACLPAVLNVSTVCDVKNSAHYVVNVTQPWHAAEAVKFANMHSVRLIVKGTGHDFLGRSTGPGLSIWTNNLKRITRHLSFTPAGCPNCTDASSRHAAITVQTGNRMRDIYKAAQDGNFTVVGGADPNVGLGGYFTGGGHSAISGKYGLQVDNAIEIELVTPCGMSSLQTTTRTRNFSGPSKGYGGGATFGVLISVTLKIYGPTTTAGVFLTFTATEHEAQANNNANYFSAAVAFHAMLPDLNDAGLTGYYFMNPVSVSGSGGSYSTTGGGENANSSKPSPLSFTLIGYFVNATVDTAAKVMDPLMQKVNATHGLNVSVSYSPPSPLYDAYGTDPGVVGSNVRLGSRLWDRKALSNQTGLESTFRIFEKSVLEGLIITGPAVRAVDPDSSGVNPAWRRAYLEIITTSTWPFQNATAATAAAYDNTYVKAAALRNHAPDMGCYLNEADADEPDFQHAFWGDHYERLLGIKRRVDPNEVFWCKTCVGSERWKVVDDSGLLCKKG